jgi:hypothetical protein
MSSISWRNIAPIIYKLPDITPTSLTAKYSSNGQVHLQSKNSTHFRIIQNTFLQNKIEFHNFSLSEDRSVKVVLKGIPTDITNEELKTELETLNFQIKYIRRFGTPNKPMPLCVFHIATTPNSKDIFLLNNLFYINIIVEPLKSISPA